ncbi:hypothetical protein HII31_01139 [Pseudocercospora fuligena]|uniref:NTF2-like domain-containing protein n=1 Tax=Pseudocercospora fuligena TaxID=685502 RepID=A0A8H6RU83_9PEZI|nr:hypothetical protein HII31_01139 [Pseudocercospora fuligena]
MRRDRLLSLLLLVLGGLLVEGGRCEEEGKRLKCLTDEETDEIIGKFNTIITTNPGDAKLLGELYSENVTTASDSLSFVFQKPLNATLAHTLAELIAQEGSFGVVPEINNIFVSHSCDTITWYWEFLTEPWPTRGMSIIFVDLESKKVVKTYREVNVGALLKDSGSPECRSNFTVSKGHDGLPLEKRSCGGSESCCGNTCS